MGHQSAGRKQARRNPVNQGSGKSDVVRKDDVKEVVLQIGIPHLRLPIFLKRWIHASKKLYILGGVGLVGVGLAIFLASLIITNDTHSSINGDATVALSKSYEHPGYETLLPKGKNIKELGGWHRVSPPGADPVYAYTDLLANVQISVSEQPLPDNFRKDTPSAIQDLATRYAATEAVEVGEVTAYIGTSVKGPQSVILAKNGLLILIKSMSGISQDQWKRYIAEIGE